MALLSRHWLQRMRLNASGPSVCSSVYLSVAKMLSLHKKRDVLKAKQFIAMKTHRMSYMGFSKNHHWAHKNLQDGGDPVFFRTGNSYLSYNLYNVKCTKVPQMYSLEMKRNVCTKHWSCRWFTKRNWCTKRKDCTKRTENDQELTHCAKKQMGVPTKNTKCTNWYTKRQVRQSALNIGLPKLTRKWVSECVVS